MRPHHPWYRAANHSWYVEIAGQQQLLGKHPEGVPPPRKRKRGDPPPVPPKPIEQAYHRLMAADVASLPKADAVTVAQVCDLFLDFSHKHHEPGTYTGYRDFLQDLVVTP
jgi:integrase/recombinase XerD